MSLHLETFYQSLLKFQFLSLICLFIIIPINQSSGHGEKNPEELTYAPKSTLAVTVENFTGDADGTTSFTGPASEDFQITGLLSVDSSPGQGTTGDAQWVGTALSSAEYNAIGTISLCETTKAFQVTGIDCWTSIDGGSNYASGDVTFVGYLHNGGTVSYTTTINPTSNTTGYDPVSFSGTPLDGVDLMSLQFILGSDATYFAVDSFAYEISTGLTSYNSVPTVSSVAISGSTTKGNLLTASYTFYDCTDSESGSTFQWYRSDDANGTNKTAISGATSSTYTIAFADVGKYISYEVTPSDGTGTGLASTSLHYGPVLCSENRYLEDFEDNTGTSFTDNGQAFSISGPSATIANFTNYGWGGSSADDRYIDNDGEADANDGGQITITTTDGADIFVESFYVWSSEDDYTRNASANLTITGKRDNVTQFTVVKNSGFNTSGTYNSFTFIDLSTEGGSDNSRTLIDELILSNTGIYEYIAIDALQWGTITTSTAFLTTSSISTFDASSATLGGEVTDDGCLTVSESGVVYNTSGSPTTSDNKQIISSGVGTFSQSITGLSASTQYFVRSYAINTDGTAYGSEQSFTTSAAFPVELSLFKGKYENESVYLSWETLSETQNKGFHITRKDGDNWMPIGFVKGQGNSQDRNSYEFRDEVTEQQGKLFYRLQQEDWDGKLSYSSIVEISLEGISKEIEVYPNPLQDELIVKSHGPDLRYIQLYNLSGKLVFEQALFGQNQRLDLSNLPSGIYHAAITSDLPQKRWRSIVVN